MSIYRAENLRSIRLSDYNKSDNQVIFSGENESYIVHRGIFLLEYLEAESGTTITIKDGNGRIMASGVSSFSQEHSPLRCEYGIEFVGTLSMAKGYFMEGVFEK
jgi:hypothetical protein